MLNNKALKVTWQQIALADEVYYKSATRPKGVNLLENIAYLDDNDPMHLMDIAYPENNTAVLPVIVHIHGGGWVYGHKDTYYKYYAMELSKRGYAVLTINYRLAFKDPFPSMIIDIFSVFKWIELNHKAFQLDPNNVFLVGDSAGAHLSALSALLFQDDQLRSHYPISKSAIKIKALGLSCGVYDFDHLVNTDINLPMRKMMVQAIFNQVDYTNHPLYPYASVLPNVNTLLPSYILSTESDSIHYQSLELIQACIDKKIPYLARTMPKALKLYHVFNLRLKFPESLMILDEMDRFFKQYL